MLIADHRIPALNATPTTARRPRLNRSKIDAVRDTPYSPYLRQWIAYRATRHRELLLNIHAAARIGLIPLTIDR